MNKEELRDNLTKVAHSFNATLGQAIFTTSGLIMLFASAARMPLLFIVTMIVALGLAWTFRHDLRR